MSNSAKIISAFACAMFLSLPALAAVPSSATNELAANGEFSAPRILVEDTKIQQPRVRVAPGCPSCGFFGG
jgi:hypothetical protein